VLFFKKKYVNNLILVLKNSWEDCLEYYENNIDFFFVRMLKLFNKIWIKNSFLSVKI